MSDGDRPQAKLEIGVWRSACKADSNSNMITTHGGPPCRDTIDSPAAGGTRRTVGRRRCTWPGEAGPIFRWSKPPSVRSSAWRSRVPSFPRALSPLHQSHSASCLPDWPVRVGSSGRTNGRRWLNRSSAATAFSRFFASASFFHNFCSPGGDEYR